MPPPRKKFVPNPAIFGSPRRRRLSDKPRFSLTEISMLVSMVVAFASIVFSYLNVSLAAGDRADARREKGLPALKDEYRFSVELASAAREMSDALESRSPDRREMAALLFVAKTGSGHSPDDLLIAYKRFSATIDRWNDVDAATLGLVPRSAQAADTECLKDARELRSVLSPYMAAQEMWLVGVAGLIAYFLHP